MRDKFEAWPSFLSASSSPGWCVRRYLVSPGAGHLLHGSCGLPELRDDARVEKDHEQCRHGEQHHELVDGEAEAHSLAVPAVVDGDLGVVVPETFRPDLLEPAVVNTSAR